MDTMLNVVCTSQKAWLEKNTANSLRPCVVKVIFGIMPHVRLSPHYRYCERFLELRGFMDSILNFVSSNQSDWLEKHTGMVLNRFVPMS